jgi:hypothetical protein
MKYFRYDYVTGKREEISFRKAHEILLTTFRDNEMTLDMLTIPNRIECRFSRVDVEDHTTGIPRVAMPGMYNLLPNDIEYDNNGNRVYA